MFDGIGVKSVHAIPRNCSACFSLDTPEFAAAAHKLQADLKHRAGVASSDRDVTQEKSQLLRWWCRMDKGRPLGWMVD